MQKSISDDDDDDDDVQGYLTLPYLVVTDGIHWNGVSSFMEWNGPPTSPYVRMYLTLVQMCIKYIVTRKVGDSVALRTDSIIQRVYP